MKSQVIDVDRKGAGQRLDLYLSQTLPSYLSRSQIKKLIGLGSVKVGEKEVSAHYRVHVGDRISIEIPDFESDETRAEDIPLNILYEDDHVIVVNKPPGMVVHPGHGNPNHTLVNALLFHTQGKLAGRGGEARPGLVHRLDKDTSGVMVIAKEDRGHYFLAKQFKNHSIERIYRVVVRGRVQHDEGLCDESVGRAFLNRKKVIVKPSGGKEALTYYRVVKRFEDATLLELRLETGRTHQIRVHMAYLGHRVLGDALYGIKSEFIDRQAVHAFRLGFVHPATKEKMSFECPLPPDMESLLKNLK